MATNKIVLDEGTTTNTGTYSGTEDAVTKHVGRVVLNNSSLAEVGTSGAPVRTDPTGTTTQPINQTTATIPAATTLQTAATGSGNGTSLPVNGYATAVINIVSSIAMSGGTTINFEVSVDDTTWVPITGHAIGTNTLASTTTTDGDWRFNVSGYKSFRARISAYSAGTITIKGYAQQAVGLPTTVNATIVANTATNQSDNIAQINGVTPLMGNGATGTGSLRVTIANDNTAIPVASHPVTNAGTFAVQAATTEADGANTTLGAKADAKSTATDTTAVTAMSVLKQISASVQAPPSQAVTNAGTFAVQAAESDGANVTLGAKADAKSTATDTTAITAMQVLKQISASVQAPPSQAVTNAGTFAVQAASAGDTAAAATDAGNPVKIGGVGKTANPTAVTDGQRVNSLFDKLGKQVVVNSVRDLKGVQQTTITSSTAETTIVTAVASTFLDLYGLILTNTSATVTKVTIKDSTSGTTRAVIEVPATDTRGFMLTESAAIPQATVNTNWTATCGTSVASVEITALYVKNT